MPQTKKASARRSASSKPKSPKAKSQAKKSTAHTSSNGAGPSGAVKDAVKTGVDGATDAMRKAKVPLVTSGAAVAGVASAVVLSRAAGKRRKVLGVRMPKRSKLRLPEIADAVTDAAKRADHLGQRVSSVASSVQKVSETAGEAAKKA